MTCLTCQVTLKLLSLYPWGPESAGRLSVEAGAEVWGMETQPRGSGVDLDEIGPNMAYSKALLSGVFLQDVCDAAVIIWDSTGSLKGERDTELNDGTFGNAFCVIASDTKAKLAQSQLVLHVTVYQGSNKGKPVTVLASNRLKQAFLRHSGGVANGHSFSFPSWGKRFTVVTRDIFTVHTTAQKWLFQKFSFCETTFRKITHNVP